MNNLLINQVVIRTKLLSLSRIISLVLLIMSGPLFQVNLQAQQSNNLFENVWYGFNTNTSPDDRYPTSGILADLDNDSDLDVAVSKYPIATGFTLLLNDGSGFYSEPIQYNSTYPSQDITSSDFNNDGLPDIALSNTGLNLEGSSISVYINQGGGSFSNPVDYTVGPGPTGITAEDFNNDGYPDIAVANYGYSGSEGSFSLLLNNGNGTFAPQVTFPAGAKAFDIKAAKMNNDNLPDLVAANENQKLNVLLNSGGNDFSDRTEYNVFSQWAGDFYPNVELANMDNDSDVDVLYSSTRTWDGDRGLVAYFQNNGSGILSTPQPISLVNFTSGSVNIKAADLNNDGWKDIVTAELSSLSAGYQVVLSDGTGGFLPASGYFAGNFTWEVMAGDVDGDGIPDIVTTDNSSLQITVHHNPGNVIFFDSQLFGTYPTSGSLDAADIDQDGDLDLISSASGRTAVGVHNAVLTNNGDGTFAPYQTYSIRSGGVQAKFRDINNDGYDDIIFATSIASPPYDFHTAINLGNGTFGPVQTWSVNSCGWYDIDAFDMDNDNDLDVVLTEWLGCPGINESGRRIYISKNNGDGTFQPADIVLADGGVGSIAGKDLNNDGNIDLVIGQPYSVGVFLGTGTGGLLPQVDYMTDGKNIQDIVIDDFNNDGIPDIAASTFYEESGMSVWLGNGDGTFMPAQNYPGATVNGLLNVTGITSGDADNDGDIDIFVGNTSSNTVSLYRNNGDDTFNFSLRIGAYLGTDSPIFGEFTGDQRMDIAQLVGIPPSGIGSSVIILKGLNTGVIPVELTSFTASADGKNIILNWTTATETNNKGFEVQKSESYGSDVSGQRSEWNKIGFVEGNGTTTISHSYSFLDNDIAAGKYIYRLKQIDFDGSFQYSKEVEADINAPLEFSLSQNYPNPFNPTTKIGYSIPAKGLVQLVIYDVLGKEVRVLVNEEKQAGNYVVELNGSSLSSGVYMYKLSSGDYSATKKLVLLK